MLQKKGTITEVALQKAKIEVTASEFNTSRSRDCVSYVSEPKAPNKYEKHQTPKWVLFTSMGYFKFLKKACSCSRK